MSLRDLGRREIALLRLYTDCQFQMSPRAFSAKWNVTRLQMARICGCSVSTADRWYARPTNYRAPAPIYQRRLAEMDFLWERWDEISPALKERFCPPPEPAE
jgi:hypothetical protein